MFRESVEHRRIVVPAAWFYEWNKSKEKNLFCRKEELSAHDIIKLPYGVIIHAVKEGE